MMARGLDARRAFLPSHHSREGGRAPPGRGQVTNETPWQEIYRSTVGQLADGGCMELACRYQCIAAAGKVPRHNH